MTRHVSLTIEQWMAMREGGAIAPPIWFTVVGGSMRPLIRVNREIEEHTSELQSRI